MLNVLRSARDGEEGRAGDAASPGHSQTWWEWAAPAPSPGSRPPPTVSVVASWDSSHPTSMRRIWLCLTKWEGWQTGKGQSTQAAEGKKVPPMVHLRCRSVCLSKRPWWLKSIELENSSQISLEDNGKGKIHATVEFSSKNRVAQFFLGYIPLLAFRLRQQGNFPNSLPQLKFGAF